MKIEELRELANAVEQVFLRIAGDIPQPHTSEIIVEIALDSNYLSTFGYEDEYNFYQELLKDNEYDEVWKALSSIIPNYD